LRIKQKNRSQTTQNCHVLIFVIDLVDPDQEYKFLIWS